MSTAKPVATSNNSTDELATVKSSDVPLSSCWSAGNAGRDVGYVPQL